MCTNDSVPVALKARIDAMKILSKSDDFTALRATFKRVMGLAKDHQSTSIQPDLFVVDAEIQLNNSISEAIEDARKAAQIKDYNAALSSLKMLKGDVDSFFDAVLVMDEDLTIRNNRLSLLNSIAMAFGEIADFTQLSTEA